MKNNDNLIYLSFNKIFSIINHCQNFQLINEFTANISNKIEINYIYLNKAFRTRKEKMIQENQIIQ